MQNSSPADKPVFVKTGHIVKRKELKEVIAGLEADGYKKVDWAIGMVNGKGQLWDYNMLSGIDKCSVPRHYHPLPLTTIQQSKLSEDGKTFNVTNGYGLPQE